MDLDDDYYEKPPLQRTIYELINENPEQSDITEMNPPSHVTSKRLRVNKKRPTYGRKHKPLVEIPLDKVDIDELHLMLRVTDVLTNNLVKEVMERDKRNGVTKALSGKHLQNLVQAINECGISFHIWEKTDGDNHGVGKYDWTSLMGADKKKLPSFLPQKLNGILHEETAETVIKVWKVSECYC